MQQRLESLAPLGLLVFLRAKLNNNSFKMPIAKELTGVMLRPSILSWIITRTFIPDAKINIENMHSSTAPNNHKIDPVFQKYAGFANRLIECRIEELEKTFDLPVNRQWSFEFSAILSRMDFRLSLEPLYYKGRDEDEHFVAFDPLLTEVYFSSYLRTLAWLVDQKLTLKEAIKLVIELCPIDLGLWKLEPNLKPDYWPVTKGKKMQGNTKRIWNQVARLQSMQPKEESEFVIIKAEGRVFSGYDEFLDLNICGFFRRCKGPLKPDIPVVVNWLSHPPLIDHKTYSLCFEGKIKPLNPVRQELLIGDWGVYPASWKIHPKTGSKWQYWRLFRGISFPVPYVISEPVKFECNSEAIDLHEGQILIAKWLDWTDGLNEKTIANLPPSTGNTLLLKRSVIDRFEKETNTEFCWGCNITSFNRETHYGRYAEKHDYKIYESV